MILKFKSYCDKWKLGEKKLLVACSGGLDSVALTSLCHNSGFDFALAHCNFKLRETESDEDETFVINLGEQLGREVFLKSFDTKVFAQENKVSVQMAARELRYSWFQELQKTKDFDYLLTAHHADDSLETFLINLSRGTGIEGLTGIPEKNDAIIRPLLQFSRDEILHYAKSETLQWREDSSNQETKYLRNKIRHEIVPKLKELHLEFLKNYLSTQEHLYASKQQLNRFKEQLRRELFIVEDDVVRIPLKKLNSHKPDTHLLHLLFSEFGFTSWKDVLHLLNTSSGKAVNSITHKLVRDRGALLLTPNLKAQNISFSIDKGVREVYRPISLIIKSVDKLGSANLQTIYVDEDKLKYPLTLRRWQKGDWFYPFGMKGKKKVSKFFKDEKVDIISKSKKWLLCSGETIVWVVGMRADSRFAVTANTNNILKLQLQ